METKGFKALKTTFGAAALCSAALLAACGGGGGGGSDDTSKSEVVGADVAGPLDPVQSQVTSGVIAPLATAVDGTPLKSVVVCTNAIVTGNVLDIADTVLVTLQSAAPNSAGADPQALAETLRGMVANIVMLIQGLAGQTQGCLGSSDSVSLVQLQDALTALNGTPLAPLATALEPVLEKIVAAAGTNGDAPSSLNLATVAGLVSQLNDALQGALTRIPASAYDAPVVGGSLTTLSVALNDVDALLTAALSYNASATGTALQALLDHSLVNVLTLIVPLQSLETSAGQSSAITAQIKAAAAALSATVGATVGKVLDPAFNLLLTGKLTTLLGSLKTLLPSILAPIQAALSGGAAGGTGGALAGTALAPVVNAVTTVLTTLLGTGNGSCPLASIPLLSVLCGGN